MDGVARFAPRFEAIGDHPRHRALNRQEWVIRADRAAVGADRVRQPRNRPHERVIVAEHLEPHAAGMHTPQQSGALVGGQRAHCRTEQSAVEALIDFRHSRRGRKAEIVFGAVASE